MKRLGLTCLLVTVAGCLDLSPFQRDVTSKSKQDAAAGGDVEQDTEASADTAVAKAELEAELTAAVADAFKAAIGTLNVGSGDNNNVTTWLGMFSGPGALLAYVWIVRPLRRREQETVARRTEADVLHTIVRRRNRNTNENTGGNRDPPD